MNAPAPVTLGPALIQTAETSVAAVKAQAEATVQARWIIALNKPRNMDAVRQGILKECDRPAFAEVARYEIKRGEKPIRGLSIRFAEAAIQCMTNIICDTPVVYDDDEKRIVSLSITDLETNVTYGQQITIPKRVERKFVRDGVTVLSTRVNSYGDTLYIIPCSDDELLVRQNALISKALRTHALRHVPGWLLEECEKRVAKTLRDRDAKDPDAARRRIFDSFDDLGVDAKALCAFLGHERSKLTDRELAELRGLFSAIKEGDTSFDAAMEAKHGKPADDEAQPTEAEQKARDAVKNASKRGTK